MSAEHVHVWREVSVGCEDCGDHEGLTCNGEGVCPVIEAVRETADDSRAYRPSWGEDRPAIDLVFADDPRE